MEPPAAAEAMAGAAGEDKTARCLSFIRHHLARRPDASDARPLLVGVNGMQGVGKTTLVADLAARLRLAGIPALACSIDDFYLDRGRQEALARSQPGNALVQHRGEPGTHDLPLLLSFLSALLQNQPTRLPRYDKAAFSGLGDRLPESQWEPVNRPGQPPVRLVLIDGWCLGFRALSDDAVAARRQHPSRSLDAHALDDLLFVNNQLRSYDGVTQLLDVFIQLDADDLDYVYLWRQQQEDSLRAARGDPSAGMTPDQVARFVDGYMPAYELYLDSLRAGLFPLRPGCHLRIIVDRERKVKQVLQI